MIKLTLFLALLIKMVKPTENIFSHSIDYISSFYTWVIQNNSNKSLICFLLLFLLQITNWLMGLFLFSVVWSIGATINGDSRKKFDAFFRLLISGTDKDHPKPKNIKISKVC